MLINASLKMNNTVYYKVHKSSKMRNFHPLQVVDRGSETQVQVGENLRCIT